MLIRELTEINEKNEKRYLAKMSYDEEFISKMKTSIPWPNRLWDSVNKAWSFSERGLEMLRNLPNVIFYEEALKEVVDTSHYFIPEPMKIIDESIDWKKFDRPATDTANALSLWEFQKIGVSRIINSSHQSYAQGLFYEMGLGKTYTAICAMKELLDRGEIDVCLIMSCVSIALDSWITTLDRMGYSYEIIDGGVKYRPSKIFHSKTEFILTLNTTASDEKYPFYTDSNQLEKPHKFPVPKKKKTLRQVLEEKGKFALVVDELHKLSNTQSKVFLAILKIRKISKYAVALTGTVIKATPERCLLPLRYLHPKVFNRKAVFEQTFTISEVTRFGSQIVGYRNLDVLKNLIHSAGMPALKKDYAKDLPELLPAKRIICETDSISIKLVEEMRSELPSDLKKYAQTELQELYIRIHQALVCPSTFLPEEKATNRLKTVNDCLDNLDGKTVIFTTLKKAVLELYKYLTANGHGCTCCSGDQSFEEITKRVDKFTADDTCSVLIATVQKMGTGFDRLKVAKNVIIYDHNSNASEIRQAVDRVHRIGQKNPVSVIHIVQNNAVSIMQYERYLQQKKLMEDVEDEKKEYIESAIDIREILNLCADSSNFLKRRSK